MLYDVESEMFGDLAITGLGDEREQPLGCARLTSIEDVGAVEEGRRKARLAKEGTWAVQWAGIAGPDTQISGRTGVPCRSLVGSGRRMELSLGTCRKVLCLIAGRQKELFTGPAPELDSGSSRYVHIWHR